MKKKAEERGGALISSSVSFNEEQSIVWSAMKNVIDHKHLSYQNAGDIFKRAHKRLYSYPLSWFYAGNLKGLIIEECERFIEENKERIERRKASWH